MLLIINILPPHLEQTEIAICYNTNLHTDIQMITSSYPALIVYWGHWTCRFFHGSVACIQESD